MDTYAFVLVSTHAIAVISFPYVLSGESTEKAVFLFSDLLDDDVFKKLEKLHWIKTYEITPRTFIFEHKKEDGCSNITEDIKKVKKQFKDTIIEIETVKHYVDVFTSNAPASTYDKRTFGPPNQVCNDYYGMGIENAWSRGFTGKGVVVAVTDVGVNTDLLDLEPNIASGLSFNFMNDTKDVTPERFPSYADKSETDHGNRCASLIAAVKGNEVCSAGIAFNATIAPLKIFGVYEEHGNFDTKSSSEVMARSHVYGGDRVDIYSNSWGSDKPFYKLNLDQREAIKTSAKKGRGGQGAVHIFPVGAPGNELANNEYTITVSAVGQHGAVPRDSVISSSVLTSGLRNGNNLTADSMVTASYGNKCISSFVGVSAATAQVAGMIALALEANQLLTLSDVQDIIVYSSELQCLDKSRKITINAAGHKFHPVFGFGLLNASKLTRLAAKREEGSEFHPQTLRQTMSCYNDGMKSFTATFCYNCAQNEDSFIVVQECLHKIKTVKIQLKYKTSAEHMRMTLISPSGTVSVLQDLESEHVKTGLMERDQIMTSVHFWDEAPSGVWRFTIQSDDKTEVNGNVSLTLFGIAFDITTVKAMVKDTVCATTCSAAPDQGSSLVVVLISLCLASLVANT